MAAATTTIKATSSDFSKAKVRLPDGEGRVKYETHTEDGILLIAYVPVDQARKSLSAFGLKLSGPKAIAKKQASTGASSDADDLV